MIKGNPSIIDWLLFILSIIYTFSPIDLVPDAPVVGWVDDAALLMSSSLNMLQKYLGDSHILVYKALKLLKWSIFILGIIVVLLAFIFVSFENSVRPKSVTYEGEVYETVVIGKQVWLKRNLNYAPTDSGAVTYFRCYEDNYANCKKYGRLYSWATAMALSDNCNKLSCANLMKTPHRGICPIGWHIPSNDDWNKLTRYVDSTVAGKHLKAKEGWNDYEDASGNGEDTYGFSALPGGVGYPEEGFYNIGNSGYWWSSNEISNTNASRRSMFNNSDSISYYSYGKTLLLSVRCLKD